MSIYRAYDCGVYDGQEPLTTVWFEANSDKEAGERLTAMLALVWQVAVDRVFVGNVDAVWEIELNSVQSKDAGRRRWLEGGSQGALPLYVQGPTLVFLAHANRGRLREAAGSAKAHAVELARLKDAEAALVGSEQEAGNVLFDAETYRDFARTPWLHEHKEAVA